MNSHAALSEPTIKHPVNARRIAVDAVVRVMRDNLALELNEAHLQPLPLRDRAMAHEIAMGTLRFLSLLDAILLSCMQKPPAKGRHFLWAVMQTALYQARWMRIPARAAIHEAVELIKASTDRPRAGFVNALLRSAVAVEPETLQASIVKPITRLAITHAHPEWLVGRWLKQVGATQTQQRLLANNTPPSLVLRTNGLLTNREALLKHLGQGTPLSYLPDGVILVEAGGVESLPGYQEGWFAVQDGAAQWVSCLLNPQPGDDILDVCAAPGGKTAHLVALSQGKARIWAVDRSGVRLQRLQATVQRLQLPGVEVVIGDGADPELLARRSFDRALVDAPCTGTGVIRRHPDIKWRRTAQDPLKMAESQRKILGATAVRVRIGGLLVYAVCSMEFEEGEGQIARFLASHPHWQRQPISPDEYNIPKPLITPEGDLRIEPGWSGMDGFFISRLSRVS